MSSAAGTSRSSASAEWIGCWSLTEPEAGSDAGGTRTKAVKDGACWVLNGGKTFTTNAQYADVCVAMAVTDRAASHHGISAFILEKGVPGYKVGKKENKLGMRASATGEVLFTDCRLPESQLLGKLGEGFVDSLRILDGGRISIAALSVGTAQGAYEAALRYSKQRKQFGRPISEFQAIQNKLADMATEIDAARLLTYRAGWMKDRGERVTKESAMAKLFASEIAVRVANEAVPDPRRLRLHQGLSGRKVLSRREALHHRRRHQRDPASGHRAATPEELHDPVFTGAVTSTVEQILAGDARALARAATAIENRKPEARGLLKELFPHTGRAIVIGITGAPGAGKSTLVDQLIRELRREAEASRRHCRGSH